MMTAEGYQRLLDLQKEYDEESAEIGKAIMNFFAICDIAKKEFLEKTDWAFYNIQKLQDKREILHKEYETKRREIEERHKEENRK